MAKSKTQGVAMVPARTVAIVRKQINRQDSIQARVQMDRGAAAEYGADLKAKQAVPAIVVFTSSQDDDEGAVYFMGDGFHRDLGAEMEGLPTIMAQVFVAKNPKVAAELYALGANSKHGVRRTQADRRKAIRLALALRPNLSDNGIGKLTNTDGKTVATVRAQMSAEGNGEVNGSVRTTSRGTTMDTANLGAKKVTTSAATALGDDKDSEDYKEPTRVLGGGLVAPVEAPAPKALTGKRKKGLQPAGVAAATLLMVLRDLGFPEETQGLEAAAKDLLGRLDMPLPPGTTEPGVDDKPEPEELAAARVM